MSRRDGWNGEWYAPLTQLKDNITDGKAGQCAQSRWNDKRFYYAAECRAYNITDRSCCHRLHGTFSDLSRILTGMHVSLHVTYGCVWSIAIRRDELRDICCRITDARRSRGRRSLVGMRWRRGFDRRRNGGGGRGIDSLSWCTR